MACLDDLGGRLDSALTSYSCVHWNFGLVFLLSASLPLGANVISQVTGVALNLACLSSEFGGPVRDSAILNFGLPSLGLSAAMNILATGLIVFKLARQRYRLRAVGLTSEVDEYTSVTGILMESAFFYTLAAVVYIPFRVLGVPLYIPFSSIQGTASMLCPALIQLRVCQGIMYGRRTHVEDISQSSGGQMRFARSDVTHTVASTNTRWSENNVELSKVGDFRSGV